MIPIGGTDEEKQAFEVSYAAAALLVACARSDFVEAPDEAAVIVQVLKERLGVEQVFLDELLGLADSDADDSSLKVFTDMVNRHYEEREKLVLLVDMWRVAFADGRLDDYEKKFIKRVGKLIDMSKDQIKQAKKKAAD